MWLLRFFSCLLVLVFYWNILDCSSIILPLHVECQTKVSIVRDEILRWRLVANGRLPSRQFDVRICRSDVTRRDATRPRITGARKSRLFRPFNVVLRNHCLYFLHRYHRWQVDRKCLARGENYTRLYDASWNDFSWKYYYCSIKVYIIHLQFLYRVFVNNSPICVNY